MPKYRRYHRSMDSSLRFWSHRIHTSHRYSHRRDRKIQRKTIRQGNDAFTTGIQLAPPRYEGFEQYVANLVNAVQDSAVWKDIVIIITYDEAGGRWDHVPPPRGDRWGPGGRVPAILSWPYSNRHFVHH